MYMYTYMYINSIGVYCVARKMQSCKYVVWERENEEVFAVSENGLLMLSTCVGDSSAHSRAQTYSYTCIERLL